MARATQGHAGWKPSRPSARVVAEVCAFAGTARQVACADPDEVSDYLRRAPGHSSPAIMRALEPCSRRCFSPSREAR